MDNEKFDYSDYEKAKQEHWSQRDEEIKRLTSELAKARKKPEPMEFTKRCRRILDEQTEITLMMVALSEACNKIDCLTAELEAQKKPETTYETQSIRRQYNMAVNNTKLIIDDDIRQHRIIGIEFQYGELLQLCDIIERLTADDAYLRKVGAQQFEAQRVEIEQLQAEHIKLKEVYNEIFENYIPIEKMDEANSKLILLLEDREQMGKDMLKRHPLK